MAHIILLYALQYEKETAVFFLAMSGRRNQLLKKFGETPIFR